MIQNIVLHHSDYLQNRYKFNNIMLHADMSTLGVVVSDICRTNCDRCDLIVYNAMAVSHI